MASPKSFQVLVAGGGLAGLRAAIAAHDAGAEAAVLSKVYPVRSHSGAAQGGINAALGNPVEGQDDSWERHAFDTVKGSDYLADQPRVETLTREASQRVFEMEHWGAFFSRNSDGTLAQRPFGGAGFPRTCFSADRTGHTLLATAWEQCLRRGIPFLNEWLVTRIVRDRERCLGVVALHIPTGRLEAIGARTVILAGGGHGRIYDRSTNALINTGSLTAAAYRAGVPLQDMEFVQFHPTSLLGSNILITEGVRGEGGRLFNARGERFMERSAPERMELAPRDIVARAIQTELDEGRGFGTSTQGFVNLDVRHLGPSVVQERLPGIRKICMDFAGLDPLVDPIPVQPGQHYSMGGLACDPDGATSLAGLYAVGECSCISVHGANRLGGNSLLETLVFGRRAGEHAAERALKTGDPDPAPGQFMREEEQSRIQGLLARRKGIRQHEFRRALKEIMSNQVGIFRDGRILNAAAMQLSQLRARTGELRVDDKGAAFNFDLVDTLELMGMLDLAWVTALTARERKESRGSHWRRDFETRDDETWLRHSLCRFEPDGPPSLSYRDVEINRFKPEAREY